MAENNNRYWEKAKDEIFRFFLWLLRNSIAWTKSLICRFETEINAILDWVELSVRTIVRWFETIVRDLSEEFRPQILLFAIFVLASGFFVIQQQIRVPDEKNSIIQVTSLIVFFASVFIIAHAAWKPFFDRFGLTHPMSKLIGKIAKLLQIGGKKAKNNTKNKNAKKKGAQNKKPKQTAKANANSGAKGENVTNAPDVTVKNPAEISRRKNR